MIFATLFDLPLWGLKARFKAVPSNHNPDACGKTILVVDDEPDVLRLLQSILKEEGYEVMAVRSAESAIKTYQSLERRPDLVLTDVVMPGMSGPMLVDHLLGIEPAQKFLFMSGFDDRQVVQRYVVERGFHLIPKPFTVNAIRLAIDEIIKSPLTVAGKGPAR